MITRILTSFIFIITLILVLSGTKAFATCPAGSPSGNGVFVVTNTSQICGPVNKGTWALIGTVPYSVYIYDNNTWNIVTSNPNLADILASTPVSPVTGTTQVTLGAYNYLNLTLSGNTTINLDGRNAVAGSANYMTLNLCQDVAGAHTLVYTVQSGEFISFRATANNPPVLSTGAASCDYHFWVYDSGSLTWNEWLPPVINNPVSLAATGSCAAGSYMQAVGTSGPTCNPPGITLNNSGSTGTTINLLAKINSSGQAVNLLTSDVTGAVGICVSGCGTTLTSFIQTSGIASCVFDGATTNGHYVTISSTVAGNCHDFGTSHPTSSDNLGQVLSTNGSGGTYNLALKITAYP